MVSLLTAVDRREELQYCLLSLTRDIDYTNIVSFHDTTAAHCALRYPCALQATKPNVHDAMQTMYETFGTMCRCTAPCCLFSHPATPLLVHVAGYEGGALRAPPNHGSTRVFDTLWDDLNPI